LTHLCSKEKITYPKIAFFGTQEASTVKAKAPAITSIGYSNSGVRNYAFCKKK
jgi:hypothetical protein